MTSQKKSKRQRNQVLPANNIDMEEYVTENIDSLMETVVDSIEYAMDKKLSSAEPFTFDASPYVVIISQRDFGENLQHIFEHSIKSERFELCAKIQRLLERLPSPRYTKNYKKVNLL